MDTSFQGFPFDVSNCFIDIPILTKDAIPQIFYRTTPHTRTANLTFPSLKNLRTL